MEKPTSSSDAPNKASAAQESAQVLSENPNPEQDAAVAPTPVAAAIPESTEVSAAEHRQVYGTAKTENLRDSGLWRIILPGFVVLLCLALLAVPLIILISLFVTSLDVAAPTHGLTWLWITMMILEVCVAVFVIRGLTRIFMTQAGNYGGRY